MPWPYDTKRWRELREKQLARQPVCRGCGDYRKLQVHHVQSITNDQRRNRDIKAAFPSLDRLETLCEGCHSLRTRGVEKIEIDNRSEWDHFIEGKPLC